MKILILGGTGFVGRILTENLTGLGIEPVLLNRGKRNPEIFPGLKKIICDRESAEVKQIGNEDWDAVIDFSGQQPDNIDLVTDLLKGRTGRYIFVSSASAYMMDNEEDLKEPIKEDFAVYPCNDEQRKSKDILANYSQKKAECERVILSKQWLDAIIFRPALIYGRYDPTDRFYYWLFRVYSGVQMLLPDNGKTRTTNTYSEEFARLIFKAASIEKHNKVYNAVTHDPVSIADYINLSGKLLGNKPVTISAKGEFFAGKGIQPWAEIPMWLGGSDLMLDNTKVKNDFGITFSTFEDSLKGCIKYYSNLGWPVPKYGLNLQKEQELVNELRSTPGSQ